MAKENYPARILNKIQGNKKAYNSFIAEQVSNGLSPQETIEAVTKFLASNGVKPNYIGRVASEVYDEIRDQRTSNAHDPYGNDAYDKRNTIAYNAKVESDRQLPLTEIEPETELEQTEEEWIEEQADYYNQFDPHHFSGNCDDYTDEQLDAIAENWAGGQGDAQ